MTHDNFVRYTEATECISAIEDPIARLFVQYGLATALTGRRMNLLPEGPGAWDLRWLCEVLKAMADNREVLEAVLAGDAEKFNLFPATHSS